MKRNRSIEITLQRKTRCISRVIWAGTCRYLTEDHVTQNAHCGDAGVAISNRKWWQHAESRMVSYGKIRGYEESNSFLNLEIIDFTTRYKKRLCS